MDNITEDEVITLLEECLVNGQAGPQALWLWFLRNGYLIERTLQEVGIYTEEEEEVQEEDYK